MNRIRTVVLLASAGLLLAGCDDWPMFRHGADRTGYNALERVISVTNVSGLTERFTVTLPTYVPISATSSAVANSVGYVGLTIDSCYRYPPVVACNADGAHAHLVAFDAAGNTNCGGTPKACAPLWTSPLGHFLSTSSPAVANGVVYVISEDGNLEALDAAGNINCSGDPKTCSPLWTGHGSSRIDFSSPAVINGVVYVGSYAFDAAGKINCSGTPTTCTPLWTVATGGSVFSSPAVLHGVLYLGSSDSRLDAFDAAGNVNCSGTPKICAPLWTALMGGLPSSPAVGNGVVYTGSDDGRLYAFDAAGNNNCSGSPKACAPLWTGPTGAAIFSSPAVANGVVYVGSDDGRLYAFDAGGNFNCSGSPKTCAPLWTTDPTGSSIESSPAVANGVVYVGPTGGAVYAFDAAGNVDCSGNPKTCAPLWTAVMGGPPSSPAVANGKLFAGSYFGLSVYARP